MGNTSVSKGREDLYDSLCRASRWVIPEFLEAVGRWIVKLLGKVSVEVHTVGIIPSFPVHKHTTNKAMIFLTQLIFERTKIEFQKLRCS